MKTIIDRSLLNVFLCSLFFAMILPKFELIHLFVLCCSQIFAELLYSLSKQRVLLLSVFVVILFSSCAEKEQPIVENLPIDSVCKNNKIQQNTENFYDITPNSNHKYDIECLDYYIENIHYKIFSVGHGAMIINVTLDSLKVIQIKNQLKH